MKKLVQLLSVIGVMPGLLGAQTMTLDSALDRLLRETTRGRILTGQHEVVQAQFNAEKIGYYLPEISLNSTLPTYRRSRDYGNYYGFTEPIFFERSALSGSGNLQLRQKIITGGDLTFQAIFDARNDEYPTPVWRQAPSGDSTVLMREIDVATDRRRLGNFQLQFSQPLFRTSESRAAYLEARDNLTRADFQWRADRADLRREGISAFFDLLTADIDRQVAEYRSHLAAYNAGWDSVKFADGVITEEAWIESKSERLEKRLALFDAEANLEEKKNEFNHLLDLPSSTEVQLQSPAVPDKPDQSRADKLMAASDKSAETELARINMEMAERRLNQTRSSFGLNGTLNASYAVGRGNVKQVMPDTTFDDKVDTKDWRVSVDFSYPIWDGGASGASVHSQELAYESARLEYLAAQRSARNKMEILLTRIDINYSKLSLLQQELDLAGKKLQDAEERHGEGIISDATLLENRIYYFEAQKNRLATLKDYYLDLTELEKTELP